MNWGYGSNDINDILYCGVGCDWNIENRTLFIGGDGNLEWSRFDPASNVRKMPDDCMHCTYTKVVIGGHIRLIAPEAFRELLIESVCRMVM